MTGPRALSVRQPYGWAIVAGGKNVENRSTSTSYRGTLLIHAASTWHADTWADDTLAAAWGAELERLGIGPAGYTGPVRPMRNDDYFPRAAILGAVDLVHAHWSDGTCCPPWGQHPRAGGRQVAHWVLARPRRLPKPIPAAGRLGLWIPTLELQRAALDTLPPEATP